MTYLKNLAYLELAIPGGVCVGGSQEWYAERFQRLAGCGPTTATNLVWYMAQACPELSLLCKVGDLEDYKAAQRDMFSYVTPTRTGGVNSSAILIDGVLRYGSAHGAALKSRTLEVPKLFMRRPEEGMLRDFVLAAIEADSPLAFLNLSNGNQQQLDSWHWVTVIGFDPETMIACISDQGKTFDVNLSAWLRTSMLGGGLVFFTI